jgi:hypothetical protein
MSAFYTARYKTAMLVIAPQIDFAVQIAFVPLQSEVGQFLLVPS